MPTSILSSACSAVSDLSVKTVPSIFWTLVKNLWDPYWFVILPALIGWLIWELATRRDSSAHYSSANGFSPTFNVFVGSFTYLSFQSLAYGAARLILGDLAYCIPWSYAMHSVAFGATWLLLFGTGFWVY